jgi:hypothetical protein
MRFHAIFILLTVPWAALNSASHSVRSLPAMVTVSLQPSGRLSFTRFSHLRGGCQNEAVQPQPDVQPSQSTGSNQTTEVDAVVTAFEVKGAVNYDRLVSLFGSQLLTEGLVERLERVTGRTAHYLVKRGIVFSHRDLGQLLDLYEKGTPFFLYTGR